MARTGGVAGIGSGDLFLAFSTPHPADGADPARTLSVRMNGLSSISALFEATVQATEEAIINALVAAGTMTGADGRTIHALSHDTLSALFGHQGAAGS